MSLEHQLQFDVSRCSLCRLAGQGYYCSPTFSPKTRFFLVLEAPDARACEENNAWSSMSASVLSRALGYACGGLAGLHLTYLMKCYPKEAGREGRAMTQGLKRTCARTCATTYLHQELTFLQPEKVLLFGELCARLFMPDEDAPWEGRIGSSFPMPLYRSEGHLFESPSVISTRGGLRSQQGRDYIQRLNAVLGGRLALPDPVDEAPSSMQDWLGG
ncbi:MAG: hypothetical protein HQL31_05660 [Planctomycetes bacterium]|nr:hypothetical protein [Planctomycetota bacterium]